MFRGFRALYQSCFGAFPCAFWLAWALSAQAHPLSQEAMWVQFDPARVHVAVSVSLKEIGVAQSLAPGLNPNAATAALNRAVAQHGEYVLQHLTLSVGTNVLAGTVLGLQRPPILGEPEQTFYQYELEYPWRGPPPGEVTFLNEMLKEHPYAVGAAWEVSYVIRAKRVDASTATTWLLGRQPATIPTGYRIDSEVNSLTRTPVLRAPVLASAPASSQWPGWRLFGEYFWHGIRHILTGYDHLLFVAALVLATRRFWEMVQVIAAFTLAHTLTLALCVFGVCRLPAWVVEPVIALSIVFVALENLLRPHRAHSRLRLAVAFGFGLVHGLGFAGGLLTAMAGLPAAGTWLALGAFSLGVEAGHQWVVLLFGLLVVSRLQLHHSWHAVLLRYGTSVISAGGVYYLCVAVQEQFFSR